MWEGQAQCVETPETGEMEKQRKEQVLISELEHSYHDFAVILHKRLSCTINADWNAEFNPIYLILVAWFIVRCMSNLPGMYSSFASSKQQLMLHTLWLLEHLWNSPSRHVLAFDQQAMIEVKMTFVSTTINYTHLSWTEQLCKWSQ